MVACVYTLKHRLACLLYIIQMYLNSQRLLELYDRVVEQGGQTGESLRLDIFAERSLDKADTKVGPLCYSLALHVNRCFTVN